MSMKNAIRDSILRYISDSELDSMFEYERYEYFTSHPLDRRALTDKSERIRERYRRLRKLK